MASEAVDANGEMIRHTVRMNELLLTGRGPNTMTLASLNALREQVRAQPDAPLLITGEGSAFSAGLDLDELIGSDPRAVAAAIEDAAEALFMHPAPVVAAVNGHAIAGGCLLLQCCDLRICTDDARTRIGMPGVALGISYPPKLSRILRYRLPPHAIERVLLEAANHDPAAALTLGLVDELVSDPLAVARERLAALAAHPAAAYAETKRVLRGEVLNVSDEERSRFDAGFDAHWSAEGLQSNRRDKPAEPGAPARR